MVEEKRTIEKTSFTVEFTLSEDMIDQLADRISGKICIPSTSDPTDGHYFGVSELAKYLSVSSKWVYKRTSQKTIPFNKVGGTLLFKRSEIDEWVEASTETGQSRIVPF
jgi:excisionase family DNA binding protein